MESPKPPTELRVTMLQIVVFAVVLAVTHAVVSNLLTNWPSVKQGFRDGYNASPNSSGK